MRSHIRKEFTEKMLMSRNGENTERLKEICSNIGVVSKEIGLHSMNETVGTLAADGKPSAGYQAKYSEKATLQTAESPAEANEWVIFCGFSEKKLNAVLKEIREKIPGGIPLKAVLTQSNSKMTLDELLRELQREHDRLEK